MGLRECVLQQCSRSGEEYGELGREVGRMLMGSLKFESSLQQKMAPASWLLLWRLAQNRSIFFRFRVSRSTSLHSSRERSLEQFICYPVSDLIEKRLAGAVHTADLRDTKALGVRADASRCCQPSTVPSCQPATHGVHPAAHLVWQPRVYQMILVFASCENPNRLDHFPSPHPPLALTDLAGQV